MIILMILINLVGCTHYAPARAVYRDIPKSQKFYTVKRGDTLYAIGFRSGYGYQRLAYWNHIKPPYRLRIGQKLRLFKSKQKLSASISKRASKSREKKTRSASQKNPAISNDKKKVLKLKWQWPIKGKILKDFSQTGEKGIDIGGKHGQSVSAAASGKVVYSGQGLVGYGNLLIIKHNSHYLSAYGNSHRLLVKEGQAVKRGQSIAEVGNVRGTKNFIHFEIRQKGKPVNPIHYLPNE